MADKEKKSTMIGFRTNDQADYYSRITSIAVNRKNAVEHIEYFLKIVDPVDLPNVNEDKPRVVVFPISLSGVPVAGEKMDIVMEETY
ncbi:hypothetical protein Tco_1566511 [Tanacetum coccineum]